MLVQLRRTRQNKLSTVGELHIDHEFKCYTLEDAWHLAKIPGLTRIPAGTYPMGLRTEGALHGKYDKRFPDMHRGMLWIKDIPGFAFVYIHLGNDPEDTNGCPLVGSDIVEPANPEDAFRISGSEKAYREVYPLIASAFERGTVWFQIVDPK